MRVTSTSFEDASPIPGDFAFCIPHSETHATFGGNKNPHLAWHDLPGGTKSLAIICHDPVVPTKPDDVNVEGREVPPDLARTDFYHWVLVDVDPNLGEIGAGVDSDGVTPHGKGPGGPVGRRGINDYTNWFAGDDDMGGDYYGYDGPCPPWNDSLVHQYVFTVYALDIEGCAVEGRFTGTDVLATIEGHVLDKAAAMGTYTLNPRLMG